MSTLLAPVLRERAGGRPRRYRPRARKPISGRVTAFYVGGTVLSAMFLFPVYWAVATSLEPASETSGPSHLFPRHFTLSNYRALSAVGGGGGVLQAVTNSLEATSLAIALTVLLSTLAGYSFSRFEYRGKGLLFFGILVTLMVPFQSILIPLYELFSTLHLTNSMVGLALLYSASQLPFATFVMRNTFDELPRELDEAARVDGCGSLRTLLRILAPNAYPGILAVVLFAFMFCWNELIAALVMMTDASKFTLPVVLTLVTADQFGTVDWGVLEAAVVVAMIPSLVVFAILQRYYAGGITAGSVKG